mmetsp:Transcript_12806/g.19213  ORF Transcript_12806/g.19213 Transcript_12806/m.19213 type:complete len:96 (-) Transcript_12806:179-466(-)
MEESKHADEMLKENSSSSGGFLCFTASSSSSSSEHSESSYSSTTADGMIIRIPGPQILGWYLQKVDPDKSTPYSEVQGKVIPQDLLDLLKVGQTE